VFALETDDFEVGGIVLQNTLKSRDDFKKIFSAFTDKVISLVA
jgi:hypothetical protein